MNEMSKMASLRLQMAMDRRSKFISALSDDEKKPMSKISSFRTSNKNARARVSLGFPLPLRTFFWA